MAKAPQTIQNDLQKVWQVIGGDILQALEESGEDPHLTREQVAEVVLDHCHQRASKETLKWLQDESDGDFLVKLKLVELCFPFDSYGW